MLEHRGAHRLWDCRRVGSACPPTRVCSHLCVPEHRDGLGVRGCPGVAELRCRGDVGQASRLNLAGALVWLELQVCQHLQVLLGHQGVQHPLQAAQGHRHEQRSAASGPCRGLGDWVQQPAAELVWPPWAGPGEPKVWLLPGVLVERLVSLPVSACQPPLVCSLTLACWLEASQPQVASLELVGVEASRRSALLGQELGLLWPLWALQRWA